MLAPKAQLAGRELLAELAEAAEVFPVEADSPAPVIDPPNGYVNVRVRGVVVVDRGPAQPGSQVPLDLRHEGARVLAQVQGVAHLG